MLYIFLIVLAIYVVISYVGNAFMLNVWTRYCIMKNMETKYSIDYDESDCMVSLTLSPICFLANIIWCILYFGTSKCFFKIYREVFPRDEKKSKGLDEV